ncbi:Beta_adaptin [Hexamita inflata]|uniref:Beta adaptin n=1 Tax=Hexamita inflata TaxID=28002 RepID=A0AA86PSY0_9EUKA|nr:Beta adaptin [Hexamita inflata]
MTTANNKEAKEQALQQEEIKEWRQSLINAKNANQQREVVTGIIKAMSTGRDVSQLFTDILKLMQTRDLKLKKLIYIFLTSNAQNNASQALLCVNALELDSNDRDSAIIRATAIRTMGSVATPDTCEYFTGPVARGLIDSDPFVRKCAATCAAKLFKVKREAVQDSELIKALRNFFKKCYVRWQSSRCKCSCRRYNLNNQRIKCH